MIVAYSIYLEVTSGQALGTTIGFCMLMYAICTIVVHFVSGVAVHNLQAKMRHAAVEDAALAAAPPPPLLPWMTSYAAAANSGGGVAPVEKTVRLELTGPPPPPLTDISRKLSQKEEEANASSASSTTSATINRYGPLIREFQAMKKGFSPLLFIFYSVKSVLLVSFSYGLGQSVLNSLIAGVTCIELAYITFILDDVYVSFIGISTGLR